MKKGEYLVPKGPCRARKDVGGKQAEATHNKAMPGWNIWVFYFRGGGDPAAATGNEGGCRGKYPDAAATGLDEANNKSIAGLCGAIGPEMGPFCGIFSVAYSQSQPGTGLSEAARPTDRHRPD